MSNTTLSSRACRRSRNFFRASFHEGEKNGSEQDERAPSAKTSAGRRHRFSRPGKLRLPDALEAHRDSSRPIP